MSGTATADYLLEFDATEHAYYVNGERKLSTTQILKEAGVVDDEWYDEECRWRGSEVHRATAAWDSGEFDSGIPSEYFGYVEAWKNFRVEKRFVPVLIEHMVYDKILDVPGTLDRLGRFGDGTFNVLIDLKTSKSGVIPKWVALQTASYAHAIDPKALWQRMAVVLMPDATFRVEPYPVDTYLRDVQAFQTLVQSLHVRRIYR